MNGTPRPSMIPSAPITPGTPEDLEREGEEIRRKVSRRILPFLFGLYIVAYLDRANVAFAKIPMMADLGFSEAVFGFGAGIFFIGYLVLEIPGALIVEHWSARKWIARILITWGVCTIAIGFIRTPAQFYTGRFFLGLAEAGFFPGVIIYLSHWFTAADRARAMAGFILAVPVSLALGAPFSAMLLNIDWFGLEGWRWMFILEGVPAVVLGVATLCYLTDRPRDARWLSPGERRWLESELEKEQQVKRAAGHLAVWPALRNPRVWAMALSLFFVVVAGFGYLFWLPTTIQKASGLSVTVATMLSGLPFVVAFFAIWAMGKSSDRRRERRWHTAVPMFFGGVCFLLATLPGCPFWCALALLCLTGAAAYAWAPSFWALPTLILGQSAAAASVGLINSIGNLGGFFGPSIVGFLRNRAYSDLAVVGFLSACFVLAGLFILTVRERARS